MIRDMELVRELMMLIEKSEDRKELSIPQKWDKETVAYHLKILDEAGYIKNGTRWADNTPLWFYASLTWEGHEFLDSIRNNNVWEKTKEGIKNKGFEIGSVPIEVIKEFAKAYIKDAFGL